jgi:hypothetical protein
MHGACGVADVVSGVVRLPTQLAAMTAVEREDQLHLPSAAELLIVSNTFVRLVPAKCVVG